jgi:hypothetical protein
MNKNAQEQLIEAASRAFKDALEKIKQDSEWMQSCILEPVSEKAFVCIDADKQKLSVSVYEHWDADEAFIDASIDDIVQANGFDLGIEEAAKRSAFLRMLADKIDESAKEWENT